MAADAPPIPLAMGEDISHTNADMSSLILGDMQAAPRETALPPRKLRVVKMQKVGRCRLTPGFRS